MGKPSRDKGRRGEQEVARIYRAAGYADCVRVPNSGGLQIKGDCMGVDQLHIEVKRQEKLNIWAALAQAEREAEWLIPTVHFRRNGGGWYVALPLEDFIPLLPAPETRGGGTGNRPDSQPQARPVEPTPDVEA